MTSLYTTSWLCILDPMARSRWCRIRRSRQMWLAIAVKRRSADSIASKEVRPVGEIGRLGRVASKSVVFCIALLACSNVFVSIFVIGIIISINIMVTSAWCSWQPHRLSSPPVIHHQLILDLGTGSVSRKFAICTRYDVTKPSPHYILEHN